MCGESPMPSTVLGEASEKNSSFLEERFNSTMSALHLVGNPAFCRALDAHSASLVRVGDTILYSCFHQQQQQRSNYDFRG